MIKHAVLALLLSASFAQAQTNLTPPFNTTALPSGISIPSPAITGTATGPFAITGLTGINGWVPAWSARFDSANSASTGTQAGYVSGDTITLATTGGTCTTAPIIAVNVAAAGAISKWLVQNPGACSTIPTQPQTQASTSGSGTGATFPLTYQPLSYQTFDNLAAAGNLRIGGAGSEAAGAIMTTSSESTCIGDKACNTVTTGGNITAVGHNAVGDSGSNPFTGANIVCVGTDCMRNPLNGAGSDVGVGVSAMKFWKTSFSTAIGINNLLGASDGTSIGDSNTTLGYQVFNTGAAGVTATKNLAVGGNIAPVATTATLNVWLGWDQATLATTAQKNVWIGNGVGAAATGMFESLLAGYNSGHALTGNSNTCVGNQTCEAATSANNNTVLGHKVGQTTLSSGSNILLLGTGTNTDSNTSNTIHIGAGGADIFSATGTGTASTSVSTIAGGLSIGGTVLPTQAAGTLGIGGLASGPTLAANGEGDLLLSTAGGLNLTGKGSTNDVSILNSALAAVITIPTGTTNVTIAGPLTISTINTGTGVFMCESAGLVLSGATTCVASDLAVKHDIVSIVDRDLLAKLSSKRGVRFTYNDGKGAAGRRIGVIANEWEKDFPELVDFDSEGIRHFDYAAAFGLTVAALQQQQHEIESLQQGMRK